jgi:porin
MAYETSRLATRLLTLLGAMIAAAGSPTVLQAAPAEAASPQALVGDSSPTSASANGPFDFLHGMSRSETMLGDMGGLRTTMGKYGISFTLQEISEVLGNVSGGVRQGAAYDGLTTATLKLDTEAAFGLHGGTFNASALQIHGTNLSSSNLLTFQTASGIQADRATRLWELWYQQSFLAEDRLDIKIGQQSLDQEFMVNANGAYLINTAFGWPILPSVDLPGGGPAYPLSALGVRARYSLSEPVTLLAGVFNGSPSPNGNMLCCSGNPQMQNPSGTSFPLNGGVLVIAEAQFAYPSQGTMTYADRPQALPRVYKLGFWYNSENMADQRFDSSGLSLANPASNGSPLGHHGNYGLYATMDQTVWTDPEDGGKNVNVFARALWAPQADRNLVTLNLSAGLTFHQPFPHRDNDTFAIGMGYTKVSGPASNLDKDAAFFSGAFVPARGGETFIELSYQFQVLPWWQLQPDMQYVFNPGGGIANPDVPNQRVGDEFVLGLRTTITF